MSTTGKGTTPFGKINLRSWEALKQTLYLISERKTAQISSMAGAAMSKSEPWALSHSWRTPWFLLLHKNSNNKI